MNQKKNKLPLDYRNVKLNLGGGEKVLRGFLNIDVISLNGVDLVWDLNQGIPLADNSVKEVYAGHVLEHLNDTVKIMEEIYRVCKNGSLVKIKVPYFKSIGAFKDPTHKSFFTEETFRYFSKANIKNLGLPDYYLKANFETIKIAYIWSSRWLRFLPLKKKLFMKYFWNIVRTMYVELRVIKI